MTQFVRFVLAGIANTIVGYAIIFACMYLLGLSPELSNLAGYALGLCISYSLNRNFTFKSSGRISAEFSRFLFVFLVSYTANLMLLVFLVRMLSLNAAPSQIISGIVYIMTAYILNKRYVFR